MPYHNNIVETFNTDEIQENNITVVFENYAMFRSLAPRSVAEILVYYNIDRNIDNGALYDIGLGRAINVLEESVPRVAGGAPLYKSFFTDAMRNEVLSIYNTLWVKQAHSKRIKIAKSYLKSFNPTITLNEALYRLSFYLIPDDNNLAKSTKLLIDFASKILKDRPNNILVDSAINFGGQGKSLVQDGLVSAIEQIGLSGGYCDLPTYGNGVQAAFAHNEVCVVTDTKFSRLDDEAINNISDKKQITIKGKYVKEWQAKSIANILIGTNFLPVDLNRRRYSVRMLDNTFLLEDHYGNFDIPNTFEEVFAWVKEAWLNLIYYTYTYDLTSLSYQEKSFDYNLLGRIQQVLEDSPEKLGIFSVDGMIKAFETLDDRKFDNNTFQYYKFNLGSLVRQLKLKPVATKSKRKLSFYYVDYDWNSVIDIAEDDETKNGLEYVYNWFKNLKEYANYIPENCNESIACEEVEESMSIPLANQGFSEKEDCKKEAEVQNYEIDYKEDFKVEFDPDFLNKLKIPKGTKFYPEIAFQDFLYCRDHNIEWNPTEKDFVEKYGIPPKDYIQKLKESRKHVPQDVNTLLQQIAVMQKQIQDLQAKLDEKEAEETSSAADLIPTRMSKEGIKEICLQLLKEQREKEAQEQEKKIYAKIGDIVETLSKPTLQGAAKDTYLNTEKSVLHPNTCLEISGENSSDFNRTISEKEEKSISRIQENEQSGC